MPMEDWLPVLAERLAGIEGIEAVYYPGTDEGAALPGALSVYPCIVIMPQRGGEDELRESFNISSTEVQLTLYVTEQVLTEAYAVAIPFVGRIKRQLVGKLKLGLTAIHHVLPYPIGANQRWWEGPGAIQYGGVPHLGITFRVVVKEQETTTVAA